MADFTRADVAHLLRRVGFGGTKAEIDALTAKASWSAVVDAVLDTTRNPADPIPAGLDDRDDEWWPPYVVGAQTWLDRMATTPTPIVEKLALFWHSNLASSAEVVVPRLVYRQVRTYRARGLGDVHALLQAMAIDPAMLHYLDNASNVAESPNENFARELMELFTLGNGAFSERDVVEMARAWTGHTTDDSGEAYVFRSADHDTGQKTIFGITKNWNGPATITEIVRGSRQETCSRFLAAKLWSFLAAPQPAASLVDDLAAAYVANDMSTKALVRAILLRPEFRSTAVRQGLVRSPIEWFAAAMRCLGITAADAHPEWWLDGMGQAPFFPPNVSGWKQNAAWISTSATWAKGSFASSVRWWANERDVLAAAADDLTPSAAATATFELFGIDQPTATTRAAMEGLVRTCRTNRESWAIPPNLVALGLLSPEFQVA